MINNELLSEQQQDQFVISYELLVLLRWLIEHDADKIKKIIGKSLAAGMHEKMMQAKHTFDMTSTPDAHYNIIEFFNVLEVIMAEALDEHVVKGVMEKNLMPAIDHIDTAECDDATVRLSIERTASKLKKHPQANAQDLLFKELLKRWKPSKKKIQH